MNNLVLLGLFACIAMTMAIRCRTTNDCSSGIKCDSGWTTECKNYQCTCHEADRAKTCSRVDDCGSDRCSVHIFGHTSNRGRWHCIDNKCHCGYF